MTADHEMQSVKAAIHHLANAISTAYLYAPEHRQVVDRIPRIIDPLQQVLAANPELTLVIIKEDILYRGKPLARDSHSARLTRTCAELGVGHITFLPGVDASDLRQLIRCAVGQQDLKTLQDNHARILLGGLETQNEEDKVVDAPIESFEHLTSAQLKDLQEVYTAIGEQGQLDVQKVTTLIGGFVAAFKNAANPLLALVPIRKVDDYTFTHSVNVSILNIAQGMSLGVDGQILHDLGLAGMLHDAGKIFIDREIIQKPDKLSEAEWDVMKSHPSRGAQYLMGQKGIPTVAVLTAYEHHMRYDLTGYPQVTGPWRLNLCSQMTMVSDTFDALRTRRAYKDPWDFPKISGLMLDLAGKRLNPDLTVNFLKLLAEMGEVLPAQPTEDVMPLRDNYCE